MACSAIPLARTLWLIHVNRVPISKSPLAILPVKQRIEGAQGRAEQAQGTIRGQAGVLLSRRIHSRPPGLDKLPSLWQQSPLFISRHCRRGLARTLWQGLRCLSNNDKEQYFGKVTRQSEITLPERLCLPLSQHSELQRRPALSTISCGSPRI